MPEQAEQEAEERVEAKAAASQDTSGFPVQSSFTVAQIRAMAAPMVPDGQCFSKIVEHESSWNYQAVNPSSGACGLFPGTGPDQVGPHNYMNSVYESPWGAWAFSQANRWY